MRVTCDRCLRRYDVPDATVKGRKIRARCDIITVEAGGHGMGTWKDADQQHYKVEMIAWLKRTLEMK